jgi:hypothetical protein
MIQQGERDQKERLHRKNTTRRQKLLNVPNDDEVDVEKHWKEWNETRDNNG